MTGAAEKLIERFGSNINQSLGVRSAQAAGQRDPVPPQSTVTDDPMTGRTRARAVGVIDIGRLMPDPDQPRREFSDEALNRLSESLKKFGQLMPIRARWNQGLAKWVIISGERRYRAALKAGLESVTCHFVEEPLPGSRVLEEQVVENCLREDLRPIEQALAFKALMETNGWSARRVAEELGLGSGTVTKALALLKLPEDIRRVVESGEIPSSVAYELSKLEGEEACRSAVESITGGKLSRDEAIALVRRKSPRAANDPEADVKRGIASDAPPSPVPHPVSVTERRTESAEGRTVVAYSLSNDVSITISSPKALPSANVAAALEGVLRDVRLSGIHCLKEPTP